jgi:hypothetical protein
MKAFKILFFSLLMLFVTPLMATEIPLGAEMADAFRADGKIYVVVAVIAIVFMGLAVWLFRLDRKISRLEKNQKS